MEVSPDPEPPLTAVPKISPKKRVKNEPGTDPVIVKHEMTPRRREALAKARQASLNKRRRQKEELKELEELRKQKVAVQYHDLLSSGEIDSRFMTREDLEHRIAEIPTHSASMSEDVANLSKQVALLSDKLSQLTDFTKQAGRGSAHLQQDASTARKTTEVNSASEHSPGLGPPMDRIQTAPTIEKHEVGEMSEMSEMEKFLSRRIRL